MEPIEYTAALPLGREQLQGDTKWNRPSSYEGIPSPSSACVLDSAAVWKCCLQGLEARVQGQGIVWLVPLEASQSLAPWPVNSSYFCVFLGTSGLIVCW